MHVDAVARNAGGGGDRRKGLREEWIGEVEVVHAVDEGVVRSVADGDTFDDERIEDAIRDAVGEIAHERDAERRCDVETGEARREFGWQNANRAEDCECDE